MFIYLDRLAKGLRFCTTCCHHPVRTGEIAVGAAMNRSSSCENSLARRYPNMLWGLRCPRLR